MILPCGCSAASSTVNTAVTFDLFVVTRTPSNSNNQLVNVWAGPVPANRSCGYCHPAGEPKLADRTVECLECHRTDMFPDRAAERGIDLLARHRGQGVGDGSHLAEVGAEAALHAV